MKRSLSKNFLILVILFISQLMPAIAQPVKKDSMNDFESIRIDSRLPGLKLSILHLKTTKKHHKTPVLFLHGASFPSSLAAGFRMNGISWMDDLAQAGYDTYALDFLGYGNSDRYPEMSGNPEADPGYSVGKTIAHDVDIAVEYLMKHTGASKIFLIGHSWGATVAAFYASQHPEKIERLVLFAPFTSQNESYDDINITSYSDMSPEDRVNQFISAIPEGEAMTLEPEVLTTWKQTWLYSDPTATKRSPAMVRFPNGWLKDLVSCTTGCYYDPSMLTVPTLLIRGEWDKSPSFTGAENLYKAMTNAPLKRYVVIDKATHVMHLEKKRFELYQEVRSFFDEHEKTKTIRP